MESLRQQGPADLLRVAREMFLGSRLHVTVMGPLERANVRRIEKLFLGFPPKR